MKNINVKPIADFLFTSFCVLMGGVISIVVWGIFTGMWQWQVVIIVVLISLFTYAVTSIIINRNKIVHGDTNGDTNSG